MESVLFFYTGAVHMTDSPETQQTDNVPNCGRTTELLAATPCSCGGTFIYDPNRKMSICNNCQRVRRTSAKLQLEPGDVVDGRFKLLKLLGKGGMGSLFLCAPLDNPEARYALKTLTNAPAHKASETQQKRLVREAKLLSSLDHKNIVKVYDAWQDEFSTYVLMEYINGSNLEQIKQGGEFDFNEATALQIMWLLADALQYAWETHKILHRDIKPANVMIDDRGHIRLLDFGIAKSLDSNNTTAVTIQGYGLGTPGYMSPEQFSNQDELNCSTDIYSLGATIYFLLTGQPPYVGKNVMEIFEQILTHEPEPLHKLNPAISENMSQLVGNMLKLHTYERPFSWKKLKLDIDLVAEGQPPKPN